MINADKLQWKAAYKEHLAKVFLLLIDANKNGIGFIKSVNPFSICNDAAEAIVFEAASVGKARDKATKKELEDIDEPDIL